MAKALYRQLLKLEFSQERGNWLSDDELHECKVRECDLLGIIKRENDEMSDSYEVLNCWKEGISLFPSSGLLFNELGNNYLQRGMHEAAFQAYSNAAKLGFFISYVNRASVLEIQGYTADARISFEDSISEAVKLKLPYFHVRLRLATVLPRVLPSSDVELKDHRQAVEIRLDELLGSTPPLNIENAAPINYGFSTGYYLAFHGISNLAIKQKMYRSYILFCPALSYGHFASGADARERYSTELLDKAASDGPPTDPIPQGDVYSSVRNSIGDTRASGVGAVEAYLPTCYHEDTVESSANIVDQEHSNALEYWGEEELGEWEFFSVRVNTTEPLHGTSLARNTFRDVSPHNIHPQESGKLPGIEYSVRGTFDINHNSSVNRQNALRVGLVSRFFFSHPVGYLFEEVIRILASNSDGVSEIDLTVEVFMVEAKSTMDPVSRSVQEHAHKVHKLSPDLNELVEAIRNAKLDILIYTDLGLDPLTYFASFSRLAPIQVTGNVDILSLDFLFIVPALMIL